tara:strand:+ start:2604 stop:3104 length:501 start_codon:yes stop_codon:yes gene_type:complete
MKTKYIIFLYGLFIVSCNNYEKYNTDEKVIYNSLLSYSSNNNYQIDTIITHFPPSTFKNIAVNFKIYKVNFVDKTNPNMTKSQYFTGNNGMIYRIGKGPNCLIISQERKWTKKDKLITDFKSWLNKRDENEKLFDVPSNKSVLSALKMGKNLLDNLPKEINDVTCK